ncbi:MAG: cyclic nucleotide-binding domain-containing protein, partial [Planctomycetes bacterium]|nr:cyclic nucleotide-binding domain-containing protein [Planctomycetota bacterium]
MAGGVKTVPAGTTLALQGKPAVALIVLKQGTVEVLCNAGDENAVFTAEQARQEGRPIETVEHKGADVYVAEAGLFLPVQPASYFAKTECTLQIVPVTADKLEPFVLQNPALGVNIAKSLARRLLAVNQMFSGAVGKISAFKKALEQYCVDFYTIIEDLAKSSNDEQVDEIYKKAKVTKTYKRGRSVVEAAKEQQAAFGSAVADSGLAKTRKIGRGEVLCNEGDPGKEMWVLARGELWVHIRDQKVGEIKAGEIVGEMLVLIDEMSKRTAKVTASQNCELGVIPADKFPQVVKVQPRIAVQLCRMLSQRMQNTLRVLMASGKNVRETAQTLIQEEKYVTDDYHSAYAGLEPLEDVIARECNALSSRKDEIQKLFDEL